MESARELTPELPEPDPPRPRYAGASLPSYRFVPGRTPHPRHAGGHSFGQSEPTSPPVEPGRWAESETYLQAVDLYNQAYWWECHELLEAMWHAVGCSTTPQGRFLQGLIQLAAANLQRCGVGAPDAGARLAARALENLGAVSGSYMGVDVSTLEREVREWFSGRRERPPSIGLSPAPASAPVPALATDSPARRDAPRG